MRVRVYLLMVIAMTLVGCSSGYAWNERATIVALDPTLPAIESRAFSDRTLRVVTYNIHYGEGTDGVLDLGRIAENLAGADIALLTEVDVNWARSGHVDQPRRIAALGGFPYVAFAPSLILPSGNGFALYGNAVLSRFPITRAERHLLPRPINREPRSVLLVELDLLGTPVTTLVTHLGLNAEERMNQVRSIGELIRMADGPVILGGDFNARPNAPEIRYLHAYVADSHNVLAPADPTAAPTFPYPNPTARIDYLFTSPDLAPHVRHHEVPHVAGSDHLPVLMEIDWDEWAASTAR